MKLLRLCATGLLLAPLLPRPATAQALDPTFSSPTSLYTTGQVYALGPPQADGKRVVSGFFPRVNGTAVGGLLRLDGAGALDAGFNGNVGLAPAVSRVKGLAGGQYLLGANGNTITVGGLTRTDLLRLNADGTADATFNAGTGPGSPAGYGSSQEYAVQPDGKILVLGDFATYNGTPAACLVRLNANGSVDATFSAGAGLAFGAAFATAVAVQPDGKILVGGDFPTFNNQPANGLVRLTATGAPDPSFTSPLLGNSLVENLLVQPDGNILVNGYLTLASGTTPYVGLARLLPTGAPDPGFVTSLFDEGEVTTNFADAAVLLQPDNRILVSGSFEGAVGNHVARLNPNGTLDLTFQAGVGPIDEPTTLGLQANGSVLVGGFFAAFGATEAPLVRLTAAGAPDAAFAPVLQRPGTVTALARQPDGKLLLGGDFTEYGGQAVHRLVRLTAAGALDAAFAAATGVLPAPVSCLALQPDGQVLAGVGRAVLRFGAGGSPDLGFGPFPGASGLAVYGVSALALQADGKVLVGGNFFGAPGAAAVNGLLRLTAAGTIDPSFVRPLTSPGIGAPSTTEAVLVQPDGRILVAGRFRLPGQGSAARVVRYEPTGAYDATFAATNAFTNATGTATGNNRVSALALQPDGKVLAAGNFGAVSGAPRAGVARLGSTGVLDPGFAPGNPLSGTVSVLARQPNGRVLLGGSFANQGPAGTLSNLARVLDTGLTDPSYAPTATPNGPVSALLVQPDGAIVLAGNFTTVGGQPRRSVARITAPNVLAVAAPDAAAARTAAWPVPAHGRLHVAPDASAHPLRVELLDALGRAVRAQATAGAAEVSFDVAGLPAGVYVLRVRYAAGAVTRRVAVE